MSSYTRWVDTVDMDLIQFSDSLSDHFREVRAQLDYEEIKLKDFTRRLRRVVFHGTSCKKAKIEQLTEAKETLNYTIVCPSFEGLKDNLLAQIDNEIKTCGEEMDEDSVPEDDVRESGKRQLNLYKSELIQTRNNISENLDGIFGEDGEIARRVEEIFPKIVDAVISQCGGEISPSSLHTDSLYHPSSGYSEQPKSKKPEPSQIPSKDSPDPPPLPVKTEPDLEPAEPDPEPPFANPNYAAKKNPISSGGKKGKGIGEIHVAKGVTFDETEELLIRFLVADTECVQIWNEIENQKNQFNFNRKISNPEMKRPWGIAVNNDYIFVTDTVCHKVFRFKQETYQCKVYGELGDGGKQFNCPKGICVDIENNVYVADSDNNRVVVFNLHFNKFLGSVGSPDKFTSPKDVATTHHTIVVLDNGDKCVHFFQRTPGRKYIRSCITHGDGGEVNSPSFFRLDPLKNIIISDYKNNRIKIFDKDGKSTYEFGTKGDDLGQFKMQGGVAVSNTGSVIVVSGNKNNGYQIF